MNDLVRDNFLQHHGILGQKWGVRRYQPYPRNYHGDGKYVGGSAGKKFAKKLKKAQRFDKHFRLGDDRHTKTSVVMAKINQGPVHQYVENSETYKRIAKLQGDRKKRAQELNDEINKKLLKKYKADPKEGPGILGLKDDATIDKFLTEGILTMAERSKNDITFKKIDSQLIKEAKTFEKESREFFSDFMGKYGDKETPHPNWTKVNIETGEVKKPTLTDVAVMGVLQDIGMLPYFFSSEVTSKEREKAITAHKNSGIQIG